MKDDVVDLKSMLRIQTKARNPMAPQLASQIFDQIRALIEDGRIPKGSKLPPMRDLADALKVNRATVQRAFQTLAQMGLIEAGTGKTTVVLGASRRGGRHTGRDVEAVLAPARSAGPAREGILDASEQSLTRAFNELRAVFEDLQVVGVPKASAKRLADQAMQQAYGVTEVIAGVIGGKGRNR